LSFNLAVLSHGALAEATLGGGELRWRRAGGGGGAAGVWALSLERDVLGVGVVKGPKF